VKHASSGASATTSNRFANEASFKTKVDLRKNKQKEVKRQFNGKKTLSRMAYKPFSRPSWLFSALSYAKPQRVFNKTIRARILKADG
jgi:hypothetical protein